MLRTPRWSASLLLGAVITGIAARGEAEILPFGPQVQVNVTPTGNQNAPAVATDAAGNAVIVWDSQASAGSDIDGSIQGRRYSAAGVLGPEFQVNSYTTGSQNSAAVAFDASGNFVVVWGSIGSAGSDTDGQSVQAQRYDGTGNSIGGQFQVNTYTTAPQGNPDVTFDGLGRFIVVWGSNGSSGTDSDLSSIQAQRYDSTGMPIGGEFQVNSYTTGNQHSASVAVDGAGNFFVAWVSDGSSGTDSDLNSIQAQRYDAAGTPLGGEFQVNTYTTNGQSGAEVAMDATGNIVVVWDSTGSAGTDTSAGSIQGQRYDTSGAPLGGQFQVNTHTTGEQSGPDVSADAAGNFVVVWESTNSPASDAGILGQRYDSTGAPVGAEFQVNTYTFDLQFDPHAAADAAGNFIVAWTSVSSFDFDRDDSSVHAQREGDARVAGKKLIVKDPTGAESERSVVVLGKEKQSDIGPLPGLGDPTASGATLRVVTTGTTSSDETYTLDASGWTALATGYRYSGPTGSGAPVKRVALQRTPRGTATLRVLLRGNVGTQNLDVVPPNSGDEGGIELTLGGGLKYCVAFGGAAGGTEKADDATQWRMINATAEACP